MLLQNVITSSRERYKGNPQTYRWNLAADEPTEKQHYNNEAKSAFQEVKEIADRPGSNFQKHLAFCRVPML